MIEIERKFLVLDDTYKQQARERTLIKQGFLNTAPERTVRVRIKGEKGYLTVKGPGTTDGTTRFELEYDIPLSEAEALLRLCEPGIIEKLRYEVPAGEHLWEVDEFLGENRGLVLAEIELGTAEETFERPTWLGEEVTGLPRYYNSQISKTPYIKWKR
jgi:CYTH domain-containing protein